MSRVFKRLLHPWLFGVSCFAAGVILSLWGSEKLETVNQNKVDALVIKESDYIAEAARQRVSLYDNGLYAVRTHVLSSKFQLNPPEFHAFVESLNLPVKFPGARGFGVIVRVPLEQEPAYVAKVRSEGQASFAIRQFKANALDRYVIQYIDPIENNKAALGLDIGSEVNRREAAEQAVDSGEIRITAPITLVQASNNPQQSFLLLLPIYSDWSIPTSTEARRAQTKAWAYAPLLMTEILAGVNYDKENFSVEFQDLDAKDHKIFFKSSVGDESQAYQQERILPVYGRYWMIRVNVSQRYINNLGLMTRTTSLSIGLFISLIVSVLAGVVVFNRRQGTQMANQAAVIKAILNGSNDAIIATDLEGRVTGWNPGAFAHFGFTEQEMLGQSTLERLVPPQWRANALDIMNRVKQKEIIKPFVTKGIHKSGDLIDILVSIVPLLDERQRVIGYCESVSNISELKNAERDLVALTRSLELRVLERTDELHNTKRKLEILLNAVPISISQWTRSGTHIISNSACQYRFGASAEEIKMRSLKDVWNEKTVPQFNELYEGVRRGYPQTIEYKTYSHKSERSYLLHLIPDFEDHAVVGLYVIELDISQLAESQTLLLEAQRETKSLLDAINQQFPYSVTDLSGSIIEVNDQFCLISGYTREELMGNNHRLINSEYHSPEFWNEAWQQIRNGKTWRGEVCNRTKSGQLIWLDTVISPTYDNDGRPLHFIALCSDVTARKNAEAAREEINRYLQDVVSASSQVSIIATDLNGTITLFNRGAENLLGYKSEDMVGKFSPAIFHKMDEMIARGKQLTEEEGKPIEGFDVFTYKLTKGETEALRWTYVRKDGSEFPVTLSTARILNSKAEVVGYIGIAHDISNQTLLEQHLRQAKEIADQANQAKSQFLANMSHEIRTPMNAVLGMLQLMNHTSLNVQQEDYVQKAHSAAKSLLQILNDILDFSKIDAGKLQIDPVEFDLEELLREISVVLSGNHKNKTVEVLFELDSKLPSRLVGDCLRLQQVLVNLASNALKFTAEGFVKIHLGVKTISSEKVVIQFSVEDTGIGISPEQQLKLFQSFSQAEASTTRRFGGTGLGLVISKHLVELMGAELCVDSKVDIGSRFYFDLELPIANTSSINSHPLIQAKAIRILVVDDSTPQRASLVAGLRSFGWIADEAATGTAALEMLVQTAASKQFYDVILLDWYMPQMDGLAAAKTIRNQLNISTPIIVMLSGFERQKLSALSSNELSLFVDSVVKPATPKQLAESIWQTLFGRFPKKETAHEKPLNDLKILVVEDNELNRQVALELFENAGAMVTLAEGGLEGVRRVTESSEIYDLVIMDLQMPDIDGLEATRRIRKDARFKDLPILAMTANVTQQDRESCLTAGMNDHIGKPIDMQLVVPLILNMTGRAPETEINAQNTEVVAQKNIEPAIALLENFQQVLSRFGGNRELFEKMLSKFEPEIRALMEKYLRAQNANDLQTGVIAMHSIKGISATMGAPALSKFAAHLEKQGKEGQFATPNQVQEIQSLIEQTLVAFQETREPPAV